MNMKKKLVTVLIIRLVIYIFCNEVYGYTWCLHQKTAKGMFRQLLIQRRYSLWMLKTRMATFVWLICEITYRSNRACRPQFTDDKPLKTTMICGSPAQLPAAPPSLRRTACSRSAAPSWRGRMNGTAAAHSPQGPETPPARMRSVRLPPPCH